MAAKTAALSELIDDVPGLALRSISKEVPWPGARCGWVEVYNRKADPNFDAYVRSLLDAKRLEVCSTSLPQLCIPSIMADERYPKHLADRALMFQRRADQAEAAFRGAEGLSLKKPHGALYATVLFDAAIFNDGSSSSRSLPVNDPSLAAFIEERTAHVAPDKRFVYWLLASTGICVVPLSGFASELPGFRFTLLEHDEELRLKIFKTLAASSQAYIASAPSFFV
ncbi:hypothetical protein MASR2M78_36340 [Treponema sp.]